jgi:hypothetical protein
MPENPDYYDVQAMIRDAQHETNGRISRVEESILDKLRETAAELRDDLAGLERTVASRTEHLA